MCIRDSRDADRDAGLWQLGRAGERCLRNRRRLGRVRRLGAVSYTHLRAHETVLDLVCRLLLETKKECYHQSQDVATSLPTILGALSTTLLRTTDSQENATSRMLR